MSKPPVIVWFRQDLRLRDNPALRAAHESGRPVLPLYILDDVNSAGWKMGAASRWWLYQSLAALQDSLNDKLCLARGDATDVLPRIIKESGAEAVYWNRCYEPWRITRDKKIKASLAEDGLGAQSFNGSVLFEPHTTLKEDGTPYKVFTPFYRRGCLGRMPEPPMPRPAPDNLALYDHAGLALDDLELMPGIRWYDGLSETWTPGEQGAQERLEHFLDHGLKGYKEGRNYPDRDNVSRLSPHLHFGEISPQTAWHAVRQRMAAGHLEGDGDCFMSELGWREFSNNLLYHFPDLSWKNIQGKFDRFPWRNDPDALARWRRGMTGVPIVDAGMRELWRTGYMHNRVRMIVGSFLVKNLLIHWHEGERWFWDTLVDADLANNSASWQWISGCGADAAPYFRIFNPVTQGKKFDAGGEYVRRYVPELARLPDKYLHAPWEVPDHVLEGAGIILGQTYPEPVVDLKASRERALESFKQL